MRVIVRLFCLYYTRFFIKMKHKFRGIAKTLTAFDRQGSDFLVIMKASDNDADHSAITVIDNLLQGILQF